MRAQINAYLRGDDLRLSDESPPVPTKITVDDVSLMRTAREIAGYIQEMEANESFAAAKALRPQRIAGFALLYVIKAHGGSAPPVQALQHIKILGDFKELIVEFFIRRVYQESTIPLYDRMQSPEWTDDIQASLMQCVERLWNIGLATGLTHPDRDRAELAAMLAPMADQYTLVRFGKINPLRVDVLNAERVINQLCTYAIRRLSRR